jgi:hypothetical protein
MRTLGSRTTLLQQLMASFHEMAYFPGASEVLRCGIFKCTDWHTHVFVHTFEGQKNQRMDESTSVESVL